jgi:hypothetical protein
MDRGRPSFRSRRAPRRRQLQVPQATLEFAVARECREIVQQTERLEYARVDADGNPRIARSARCSVFRLNSDRSADG